jgi:hypothetical protein
MLQDDIFAPILCVIVVISLIIWIKSLFFKRKIVEKAQIIYMKPSLSIAWFVMFLLGVITFFKVENPIIGSFMPFIYGVGYLLGGHYHKYSFDDNAVYKLNPFTKKITSLTFASITVVTKDGFDYQLTNNNGESIKLPSYWIYHGILSCFKKMKLYNSNIDFTATGSIEAELEII